ncbi:MazG nucleotide pyrophosphohydrolase domain protein [Clavibacter michiganensis]|uniref:MazG nucleotide pyrophosphohydrolase domain protein n=2 Tax=Clavibacter michiganensis TaxID=28447 RepID=A0A251YE21_9MICO|nr:MazG nucleotide pyrophosphohydrolase domain protein [Clavibacter michiganensis]
MTGNRDGDHVPDPGDGALSLADGRLWHGDRVVSDFDVLFLAEDRDGAARISHKQAGELLFLNSRPLVRSSVADEGLHGQLLHRQLCSDVSWGRASVLCGHACEGAGSDLLAGSDTRGDRRAEEVGRLRGAPLRDVQRTLDSVYGRMTREQALMWTMEELGELAQAMRRHESPQRISEELGQVAAWVFCLGNIVEADVGVALETAVQAEVWRQYREHGALRPAGRAS